MAYIYSRQCAIRMTEYYQHRLRIKTFEQLLQLISLFKVAAHDSQLWDLLCQTYHQDRVMESNFIRRI